MAQAEAIGTPSKIEAGLELAIRAHLAGEYKQAEDLYRRVLEDEPCTPDAWNLLGVLLHQCGDDESAVEFIEQALSFVPNNAVYWNNLAEAWRSKGEYSQAIQCSRKALELQPDFVEVMFTLATALIESGGSGEKKEGMARLSQVLKLKPDNAEGLLQYGLALCGEQRFADAIVFFRKACLVSPVSVEPRFHLGRALEESGQYPEALECYQKASVLNPSVGEIWNRWGELLIRLGQFPKAVSILSEAVRCNSKDPVYHYNYGHALQMDHCSDQALAQFANAIELGGNTSELHNNIGILLKEKGLHFQAAESFHRALSIRPDSITALNNLGAVCADLGLTSEALECIQLLVAKRPDLPSAHNNLGKLLKDSGRAAEALESYKRAVEHNPDIEEVHHNYLLCLNYIPNRNPLENYNLHRAWGRRMAKKFPSRFAWAGRSTHPDRKLRIGYVSADLCEHPVAYFIGGLLSSHNKENFEVVVYSDVRSPDSVTQRLQGSVETWRETRELSDADLAQRIWSDNVDILVDLGGHTAYNRLGMFSLKPAPIQVSYLGYPASTGLESIDYRITDHLADPKGTADRLHSESLVRLTRTAWCFQEPTFAGVINEPPSVQTGRITFGSFNQLAKINPDLLGLWCRLLHRVPSSRIKLKAKTLQDPVVRRNLAAYFGKQGIEESRVELTGFSRSIAGHFQEYSNVDIALDSFPYHGTTTTCEALWMGVPVISLAGDSHVSRVGVSLLNAVGLDNLIADAPESYIEIAAKLAHDSERLFDLRRGMRARMAASPLMDLNGFTAAMEQEFRAMWRNYLNK